MRMPDVMIMIKAKRVYSEASEGDGLRVLVDGLWPRGLTKEKARVDIWIKEAAPSEGLRIWFSHDPAKWDEFRRRYRKELRDKWEFTDYMIGLEKGHSTVTLLYAARDEEHNNALALLEYLLEKKGEGRSSSDSEYASRSGSPVAALEGVRAGSALDGK